MPIYFMYSNYYFQKKSVGALMTSGSVKQKEKIWALGFVSTFIKIIFLEEIKL